MVQTVQAKYEYGVLKPSESLDLEDGEVVTVAVDASGESEPLSVANSGSEGESAAKSILGMFDEVHDSVPESAWDSVPTDGAINYKHYLYGWPKGKGRAIDCSAPGAF